MKTNILSSLLGTGAALALVVAVSSPSSTSAQDKAASQLVTRPATAVSTPAAPAMACPACKTEYTARADTTVRGAIKPALTVAKHLCDSCDTTVKLVGTGKAAQNVASHNCAMGGKAAGCCD